MKRGQITRGLAGLVLALIAMPALAELTVPGFSHPVSPGDLSLKFLGNLFGGMSGIPGGSALIGSLMGIFNASVMSLASLLAFYVIVSSVVQTAHDGEVLGQRYSSLWVPIRSASAIAMIVPSSGGFSGVQLLVVWVAVQGAGLANSLTNAGYSVIYEQGGFVKPVVAGAPKEAEELALSVAKIAACMAANEKYISLSGSDEITSSAPTNSAVTKYGFLVGKSVLGKSALQSCGRIETPKGKDDSGTGAAGKIRDVQSAAVLKMYSTIKEGINEGLKTKGYDYGSKVREAAKAYDDTVTEALNAIAASSLAEANSKKQSELAALKAKGWYGLGESYMTLARLGSAMDAVVKRGVVSAHATPIVVLHSERGSIRADYEGVIAAINSSMNSDLKDENDKDSSEKANEKSGNWIYQKFSSWVTESGTQLIKKFTVSDHNVNPLLAVKQRGDYILDAAGVMLTVSIVGSVVGGLVPGTVAGVLSFIAMMVVAMITMGISLSVYLPMVPYIIWISVLLAWAVAVLEAVIAAPLWMMMHLTGEGHGIASGATESGYKFIAAVFLRPALSVIAFFSGAILLVALFSVINEGFIAVVRSVQSDTITGFFQLFGFVAVYSGLCVTLVNKAFGLTLTLPSTILRWIGSSMNGDDGVGGDVKGHLDAEGRSVENAASHRSGKESFARDSSGPAQEGGGGGGKDGAAPERGAVQNGTNL